MSLIHLVLLELEYDCVQFSGKLALPPVDPDRKEGVTADRCIFSYPRALQPSKLDDRP
jgi:hypothetical protein